MAKAAAPVAEPTEAVPLHSLIPITVKVTAAELRRALANAELFTAKARDGYPILSLVRVRYSTGELPFAATDSYSLYEETLEVEGPTRKQAQDYFLAPTDRAVMRVLLATVRFPDKIAMTLGYVGVDFECGAVFARFAKPECLSTPDVHGCAPPPYPDIDSMWKFGETKVTPGASGLSALQLGRLTEVKWPSDSCPDKFNAGIILHNDPADLGAVKVAWHRAPRQRALVMPVRLA